MINIEGLRRRNFSDHEIKKLQQAFKIVYRRKLSLSDAVEQLKPMIAESPSIAVFVDSIESSTRGIVRS
jgi:UDP-N-acetylglucosamine acyltransferase